AWVQLYPGWTPLPEVRTGAGSAVQIKGSQAAPVGGTICRYGATTGWRCGTVTALNATVFYAQGAVYGLTRTSVCAEPGDSGGPFVAGNQAQGMLSGGSGNCTTGGTSYFQPVREALSAYGLTLLTA
ncbi:MAG TPA: S1 family peptidase, partial [Micromonospora sp.]